MADTTMGLVSLPEPLAGELRALGRTLRPAILAIDGPAASGKSTIGCEVATLLDYLFFDTGIMYLAVTWAALTRAIDVQAQDAIGALAIDVPIDVCAPDAVEKDGRQVTVLVDGADVTWQLRAPEVDRNVSVVSAYASVRDALTLLQRRIAGRYGRGDAEKSGIVMVGRDIGTVVVPDAAVKVYMDATAEERAHWRHRELLARGEVVAYERVLDDIRRRDAYDSQRDLAPLRTADDALVIDTTMLAPHEVVARIIAAVRRKIEHIANS